MIEQKAIAYALQLMASNVPCYTFTQGRFFGRGDNYKGISYKNFEKAEYPHIDELQITAGKGIFFVDLEIFIKVKEEIGTLEDGIGESRIREHEIMYRVKNFSKRKFMKVYNALDIEREKNIKRGIELLQKDAEQALAKTLEIYESDSL